MIAFFFLVFGFILTCELFSKGYYTLAVIMFIFMMLFCLVDHYIGEYLEQKQYKEG